MKRLTHPMRLGRVVCLVAVFIIAITGLQPARAQSESGSAAIEGAVLDGSGAAIAGASINVRNVETGLTRSAVTGANGDFNVPVLPCGFPWCGTLRSHATVRQLTSLFPRP